MIIAIDIDNTLLRCRSLVYELMSIVERKVSSGNSNKTPFVMKKGEARRFANKHRNFLFGKLGNIKMYEQIDGALDVINKICESGNQVVFLSNRPNIRFLNNVVMEWLEQNKVQYDFVVVNCGNKAEFCKKHNIELLIDDSVKNCREASKAGIKTILFGAENSSETKTTKKHKQSRHVEASEMKTENAASANISAEIYKSKTWKDVLSVLENILGLETSAPTK